MTGVSDEAPQGGVPGGKPALRRLHADATIIRGNQSAYRYWVTRTSEAIVASLQPGSREPLMVEPDGTVTQGNTRTLVLEQRGFDINSLPRTPYPYP